MKKIILLALCTIVINASAATISYQLDFSNAAAHYVNVKMSIEGIKKSTVDIKMPVWAPGSYLIREFPKNVEGAEATNGKGGKLMVEKINKNTWRVASNNSDKIEFSYKVYANELSVRTSHIDLSHAYFNGTSIFMFIEGYLNEKTTVKILPYNGWKEISTSLDMVNNDKWTRTAPDYDLLVDSPFEIGNQSIFYFEASGVKHEVALYGQSNCNQEKLKNDMIKIVQECTAIFGEHPCKNYVFIIHNLPSGGGGLEHLNSTTLQTSKWGYESESSYTGFLSLVAHEYFHLWNVKRLRPVPLGPFNYSEENYTSLLWFSEGVTSYYDDYITRLAGFYSPEKYLEIAAGSAAVHQNTPGNSVQSVTESSIDAWIKFYRPNENSSNSTSSYYSKGALMGILLDLEIMNATKGSKTLNDVMKAMYQTYYKKLNRGFTEAELKATAEQVAGVKLDELFNLLHTTDPINYSKYFAYAGLKISDRNATKNEAFLGATTSSSNGKTIVQSVTKDAPAQKAGLTNGDEIIAINGNRVNNDLANWLALYKPGDKVQVIAARDGSVATYEITLAKNPYVSYKLEKIQDATEVQKTIYKKWLRTDSY